PGQLLPVTAGHPHPRSRKASPLPVVAAALYSERIPEPDTPALPPEESEFSVRNRRDDDAVAGHGKPPPRPPLPSDGTAQLRRTQRAGLRPKLRLPETETDRLCGPTIYALAVR